MAQARSWDVQAMRPLLLGALGLMIALGDGVTSLVSAKPVRVVADQTLEVTTSKGKGLLALYVSPPTPVPGGGPVDTSVDRAVIVLHGRLRNADTYFKSAQTAAAAAGDAARQTLLIVPQFLNEEDEHVAGVTSQHLRWEGESWQGGEPAIGPAALSSFEALDAILAMLADNHRFPLLKTVVVAGHSGGGQVAQRYAVVGNGEARLAPAGVHVRYVIANPSSYLYFSEDRPVATKDCAKVNRWKYGWTDAPDYARALTPDAYESRYLERDVVYLLGTLDTDPQHSALDKSCAGEAQGPFRYARGHTYLDHLAGRHPGFKAAVFDIPGVGHDGDGMLTSDCGVAALFDAPVRREACSAILLGLKTK